MAEFRHERLHQSLIDEMAPLLQAHWEEIAHYKDVPLDPDYDAYLRAEHGGRLRVYTARADKLIGYAVFFVGNLHYKSTHIATQDVLFVHPEHRGGTGYRLIRFCDAQLKAEGVEVVYHHVKLEHQELASVLSHAGYAPIDLVYGRRL